MQAIAYSCNYYFYEVGRLTYNSYMEKTGENPFDIVAKALGLGEATGIELPEAAGARANAEEKNKQYAGEDAGWFGADVLQAVIGQSLNKFTPCSWPATPRPWPTRARGMKRRFCPASSRGTIRI